MNSTASSGHSTIAAISTGVHSRIIGLSGNLSFGSVGVNITAISAFGTANAHGDFLVLG